MADAHLALAFAIRSLECAFEDNEGERSGKKKYAGATLLELLQSMRKEVGIEAGDLYKSWKSFSKITNEQASAIYELKDLLNCLAKFPAPSIKFQEVIAAIVPDGCTISHEEALFRLLKGNVPPLTKKRAKGKNMKPESVHAKEFFHRVPAGQRNKAKKIVYRDFYRAVKKMMKGHRFISVTYDDDGHPDLMPYIRIVLEQYPVVRAQTSEKVQNLIACELYRELRREFPDAISFHFEDANTRMPSDYDGVKDFPPDVNEFIWSKAKWHAIQRVFNALERAQECFSNDQAGSFEFMERDKMYDFTVLSDIFPNQEAISEYVDVHVNDHFLMDTENPVRCSIDDTICKIALRCLRNEEAHLLAKKQRRAS